MFSASKVLSDPLGDVVDGAVAIAVGIYFAAAAVQGNAKPLLSALIEDRDFLNYLVAILALYYLWRLPGQAGKIASALIAVAIVAFLMKTIPGSKVSEFASGKIGVVEFVLSIFGQQGK